MGDSSWRASLTYDAHRLADTCAGDRLGTARDGFTGAKWYTGARWMAHTVELRGSEGARALGRAGPRLCGLQRGTAAVPPSTSNARRTAPCRPSDSPTRVDRCESSTTDIRQPASTIRPGTGIS